MDPSSMWGPKLYSELAAWWPLLSAPEEYAEEAEIYRRTLVEAAQRPVVEVLELGSGGGNNASHLKRSFELTLVDLSPEMLDVSRALNPECEHVVGDMRTVRLDRDFDAVFVHDAVSYLTTESDLASMITTAYVHCRPGAAVLLAPDDVRETFVQRTDHGGHDGEGRGLRYLEWTHDPDPSDTTYVIDFAYVLRSGDEVGVELDRHVCGLFERATWLRLMEEAGFASRAIAFEHSEATGSEIFVGVKAAP